MDLRPAARTQDSQEPHTACGMVDERVALPTTRRGSAEWNGTVDGNRY